MPRNKKAIVVLQQQVVTEALVQGDVVGLFDFEMLLRAAKQQRSRDEQVRHWQRVGPSWFYRGLVLSGLRLVL
jgi:hypothetical protein